MKDITVLTTACAAMFMPGFFRCLKENGERRIKIIGVDMAADPMMGQLLDGYYQVGACTAPGYVEQLLDICRRERVEYFSPIFPQSCPSSWHGLRNSASWAFGSPSPTARPSWLPTTNASFMKPWLPVDCPSPPSTPFPAARI